MIYVNKVRKMLLAAVGALVSILTAAYADDVFDVTEQTELAAQAVEWAVTIFLVWRVPNAPERPAPVTGRGW